MSDGGWCRGCTEDGLRFRRLGELGGEPCVRATHRAQAPRALSKSVWGGEGRPRDHRGTLGPGFGSVYRRSHRRHSRRISHRLHCFLSHLLCLSASSHLHTGFWGSAVAIPYASHRIVTLLLCRQPFHMTSGGSLSLGVPPVISTALGYTGLRSPWRILAHVVVPWSFASRGSGGA